MEFLSQRYSHFFAKCSHAIDLEIDAIELDPIYMKINCL